MVHFIVGEDHKKVHEQITERIQQMMMKNNIAYEIHHFYDYDKSFIKMITKNIPNKIYILDIETPSNTGIEMARKIRETDIDSMILFLTAYHSKYKETILESEFMFLAFLSKKKDFLTKLEQKLQIALQRIDQKHAIRFYDQSILYTIPMKDILYITTDTQARKTLIITDYTTFKVNQSLYEIGSLLNEHFTKTHRSCIVNKKRIIYIDIKNRRIYFDNQTQIDLISREYKKKMKDLLEANFIHSN